MSNKDIARQWFSHIDAKDFAALRGLSDSRHRFRNPITPAPLGLEEHLGMIQNLTTALKGGHTLEKVLGDGDYVVVEGRFTGKHVSEFMGVPATGNPVEFSFIDILHFEGGKLTDEHLELNPASIMDQIGAPVGANQGAVPDAIPVGAKG